MEPGISLVKAIKYSAMVVLVMQTAACRPSAEASAESSGVVTASQGWSCRNQIEIQCAAGRCAAADSFTPMSVEFDDAGYIRVCAYSGCSEGQGAVRQSGQFLVVTGHQLPFQSPSDEPVRVNDVAIVLDRSDATALLKMDAFAMPFSCSSD